ncbi:MAG: SDR family oxidoreductase [Acidimicrobiia bacterium]|nr:SDR family oxidoreductase [Acidimicrobiia bacterium]
MLNDFTGRVAIVTGGASGMGAATSALLAERGATVIVVDQNNDLASKVCESLHLPSPIIGDVSDSAFCNATIAGAIATHGRLDVLVNAAGVIVRSVAATTSDDEWRRVMSVNVDGTFFMCRAAVRAMAGTGGAIVNFGSIWGDLGAAGVAAYCASKGAVHNLTRALAIEHASGGIRVNAVCPGEVDTPMLRSERTGPVTDDMLEDIAATVPMGRLAQPAEVAEVVAFLASDRSSYMTGALVSVDAGYGAR